MLISHLATYKEKERQLNENIKDHDQPELENQLDKDPKNNNELDENAKEILEMDPSKKNLILNF